MSNEWKDYQCDIRTDFEYNFEAAIDGVPDGWIKSFFPQLKDEIFKACGAYADEIMFYQIKEKYGQLTVYWNFPDKDYYTDLDNKDIEEIIPTVQDIIKRYTEISRHTCIICGKETAHMTYGHIIVPLCGSCEDKL